jgi:leucyl/phenylalanyl-tRNA--protein transferase
MPIFQLTRKPIFPAPELAEPDGLLAIGGDLSPERLISAYQQGIFPWFSEGDPILWWSPDPRLVLEPASIHISKSLQKIIFQQRFEIRFDTAFAAVISHCAEISRKQADGTWITPEMKAAYIHLHELGLAHSVESWQNGHLVGGLYGISLGRCFFGESMFAAVANASKVALAALAQVVQHWDFELIDCQVTTGHLLSLGAREISRKNFLTSLQKAVQFPTQQYSWKSIQWNPERPSSGR